MAFVWTAADAEAAAKQGESARAALLPAFVRVMEAGWPRAQHELVARLRECLPLADADGPLVPASLTIAFLSEHEVPIDECAQPPGMDEEQGVRLLRGLLREALRGVLAAHVPGTLLTAVSLPDDDLLVRAAVLVPREAALALVARAEVEAGAHARSSAALDAWVAEGGRATEWLALVSKRARAEAAVHAALNKAGTVRVSAPLVQWTARGAALASLEAALALPAFDAEGERTSIASAKLGLALRNAVNAASARLPPGATVSATCDFEGEAVLGHVEWARA
jgi:hypothetical protein